MMWSELRPNDVLAGRGRYSAYTYLVLKKMAYDAVDVDWKVLDLSTGAVTCVRGDSTHMSDEVWEVFRP